MAGFKSPLARKSAVALTVIGSALGGLLSSARSAQAQQPCASLVADRDYADCMRGEQQRQENQRIYTDKLSKEWAERPIANSQVNQRHASQVYDAVVKGIIATSKIQSNVLEIIDSQDKNNEPLKRMLTNNNTLMGLLASADNGTYLSSIYVMRSAIADAANYIRNGAQSNRLPALSPSEWAEASSGAQQDIDALVKPGLTEFQFVSNMHATGTYFVGRTDIAAGVVLTARNNGMLKRTPPQIAGITFQQH